MTLMQSGCDWYFCFEEAVDCTNLIFNSGTGTQTAGFKSMCTDGYYQIGIGWSWYATIRILW